MRRYPRCPGQGHTGASRNSLTTSDRRLWGRSSTSGSKRSRARRMFSTSMYHRGAQRRAVQGWSRELFATRFDRLARPEGRASRRGHVLLHPAGGQLVGQQHRFPGRAARGGEHRLLRHRTPNQGLSGRHSGDRRRPGAHAGHTHHRGDRTYGNYLFTEATIVAQEQCRQEVLRGGLTHSHGVWTGPEWDAIELAPPFVPGGRCRGRWMPWRVCAGTAPGRSFPVTARRAASRSLTRCSVTCNSSAMWRPAARKQACPRWTRPANPTSPLRRVAGPGAGSRQPAPGLRRVGRCPAGRADRRRGRPSRNGRPKRREATAMPG